ncbi:MAG TPA: peptidylprolyl isomerase [Lautropia sp.]|nr:peptidylprolyl isomerase [Lautropia sp.]
MSPTIRKVLALMAAAFAVAMSAAPAGAQRSGGQPIDRVIAVVNQEAITARELESRAAVAGKQLREQGRTPPSQDVLMRQVLEQMILMRAQAQYAKEVGAKPSEADVDRAVADVAQQNGVSVQQLREQLSQQGISLATFREQIAGEIINLRLREREAVSKVSISEAEVDAQLAKRGGVASTEYEIAQILLRLPTDPGAQALQAKTALAEDLVKRAAANGDFAELAREHSESPEALKGGSLGWRTSDRLPELFVSAVSKLQPGQVAPVVRSPAGLHVLKLIDKRSQAPQAASVNRTRARHILIPAATPAAEEEARRRLTEFKRTIQAGGASFESLARQFSTDGSAAKGGDLGWLYPGETVPEFERAMRDIPVGAIGEPVKTPFGLHLIEVLERRAAESSPEQMRAAARQALREQKADEAFDQWLREIRDRAYVEYRLEQP